MRHLVRALMVVFGLAMLVAGPADGDLAITATGVGLLAGGGRSGGSSTAGRTPRRPPPDPCTPRWAPSSTA